MWLINFLKWIAGAIQDDNGKISSKRLNTYWAMYALWRMTVHQMHNTEYVPNETLLYAMVGIVLFGIGAATSATISKFITKQGDKKE